MEMMLRRIKDAGANVVWIGHNNPGEVIADKAEPGLSYAVWAAAQDSRHPERQTALAMIEAQHRMLRAARAVGLPAVFPIGYQIHMGRDWRDAHPKEMRHDAAGQWLDIFNGGVSASPYSAAYRADIRRYYEWVRDEFVMPYRDVILMLNLADEPLGGDYSAPAEKEFTARTGQTFATAAAASLGAFQDSVIVDHAVWSAEQWLELAPDVPMTISFCGSQGRWSYGMPNVEALFRETPPNFVPTFDAYVHDYLPWKPLTEAEVGSLALFVRTLGYYSERYDREFWLWSAGNRWGLAGYGSSNPGGVSDAVANGYLLALAARSTGGNLRGMAVWAYNVKDQGLYGDSDPAPYDRETLFVRVSESFTKWRRLMGTTALGARAEMLIYLSETLAHAHRGATRNAVSDSALDYDALLPLTRQATRTARVGELPLDFAGVHTLLVLDPTPATLSEAARERLREFAGNGGRLIATAPVLASLRAERNTVIIGGDPLALTADEWAALFPSSPGIHIATPDAALVYLPAGDRAALPVAQTWRVFDRIGTQRPGATKLHEHEVALSP
jgi:hypothetical protein